MSDREIFDAALAFADSTQRSAYLDQACAGDAARRRAARRRQIEGLLEMHAQVGSFLESPAGAETMTVDQPTSAEDAGTVIGPYKLLQQIGEGGMGTVFMAEQTHPVRRKVALKLIRAGMDTQQVIARFEAERQALAMMDHLNIARVLDVGATDTGRPYFVMELVQGVPITKYCDDNHLTPRQRLELFVPVCQAIQHAHQKGIIHRDIKPSNVMVTLYDGKPVPKVIDFGVAKATEQKLAERTFFTQFGTLVGTLEYMSPEQAEMSGLGVDTRGDIYSLGVLLYELLTGSTPLERPRLRETAYGEVLRLIREEEAPRPSKRLSSSDTLPAIAAARKTEPAKLSRLMRGELDWIVLKALEKDRTRRYETASSFAADVQHYLNDEPVRACPPSATYRLRKFARRNRAAFWTIGVVALALVVGTIVSVWQAVRATEAEGLAQTRLLAETEARNDTRDQLHLTQQAEDRATNRLYRSLVAQAQASRLSRRIGQRFQTLEVLAEAATMALDMNLPEKEFLKLRNEAIACLALPDLQVAKEWDGWPTGSFSVDFAGTLERYARVDRQGVVSVRRVADDTEIYHLAGMGPGESSPVFSSDGQFLALGRGQRVQLWMLADQEPVPVLEGSTDTLAVAFSPDGHQFARALPDGSICLYDLPSGRQVKQLEAGPRALGGLAFHPKERQLAIGCATGVLIRELDTGAIIAELKQPGFGWSPTWHPDGKTLAVAGADQIIHIWDVVTRKPVVRLEGHKNGGIKIAFNHAGDLLASTAWDSVLRLWDPRTGQQLFNTQTWAHSLRFSADDKLLAAGVGIEDKKLRLWEVAPALAYRTLVRDPVLGRGSYYTSAIHPDGRLLAVGVRDGTDFWDLASGNHLASIKLALNNYHVLFEPSGALLTNGPDGLRRWPVRAIPASAELLRVGPPQQIAIPGSDLCIARSLDGRVLASAQLDGGMVLHRDRPDQPVRLGPHADVRYVAVSPDGRLVATGSHNGTKVRVWHAQSGKLEKELPVEIGSWVEFSPDGRWLATNGGGCRVWAVDGWQQGPQVGGRAFTFSPNSKLLAVETGYGVVRLVDPDSGREYARLEDPNQDRSGCMSFTPDGTQLVTTNNDSHSIHVWNLRAVREQLAKMDLDWDPPPYPPATAAINRQPLRIQVDLGELTPKLEGVPWITQQVIEQKSHALKANPNSAEACNDLAWTYLTAPETLRDWKAALPLAQKAVQLDQSPMYRNTLGLAYYRAGRYREAVDALQANLKHQVDWALTYDLYFLAMSHQQLGESARAREFYDLAVRWSGAHKEALAPFEAELAAFHAEAEEILKIEKKASPK
jgi:serine/threonine protein kinase/WD40 repeat protein